MHYRTLIVSDLHLGAPDAKYKQLANFLNRHTFDNLILNGDIIDGMYLKFFDARKTEYTKFLEKIIALTQKNCKITYIMGNHDLNRHKKLALNRDAIEIKMNMVYKSGNKDYFICHGQQLDEKGLKGLEDIAFLGGVFVHRLNRIYNKKRIEKGLKYKSIISKVKDIGKYLMVGNTSIVHNKIIKMCIAHKTDGFICGHIHHSANMFINGFHYLNSGDWVESMTALAETSDHQWSILRYE
ncbi:MAG: UDP-2,3-diacylglucosamine diphosphatase [Candidatus Absconditabacteria bacterium]